MNRLKYNYKVKNISIRVSEEMFELVNECCHDIGISKQDYITHCVLFFLDPCEILIDNSVIPDCLSEKKKRTEQIICNSRKEAS